MMSHRGELSQTRASAQSRAQSASLFMGLLKTARPRQWIKNLLVFAAPGAAGVLNNATIFERTAIAFVAFCLAASGTYFVNDSLDYKIDRAHPTKRERPVAAGIVSIEVARVVGAALIALSLAFVFVLLDWKMTLVLSTYVVLTLSYSLWLKHQPVIDIATVASGFVIRAIGGGVAAHVGISEWFLIVASFGSLFVVTGKRSAEFEQMARGGASVRPALALYTASFLRYVRSTTSAVAIAAYCLWAFERANAAGTQVWFQLSIVPFVLAILRYALLLESGYGGAPEDVILTDRTLQVLCVIWTAVFAIGVYVA